MRAAASTARAERRLTAVSVVEIRYTRPPTRLTTYRQSLVHRAADCIVTYMERAALQRSVTVRDRVVLENGAPAIWFTFPDAWYDIGLVHTRAGSITGWYTNILTPVEFLTPLVWATTDLLVDVWLDDERAELLDLDELSEAEHRNVVTPATAARARAEAQRILTLCRAGAWPPPGCRDWSLDRVRAVLSGRDGTPPADPV
jgi:predicted RNA-binding protein associated with RNAse of E/G family